MHGIMEKNAGIAVSMPKGTTSKETVETRSYDTHFFMCKFPELLGSTSYVARGFRKTFTREELIARRKK
jgi:hypothetical protein